MTLKHQRLLFLLASLVLLGIAAMLILTQFKQNIIYFYTPSDLLAHPPQAGKMLRLGGLVRSGSLKHRPGNSIVFTITDEEHDIQAHYTGLLPNLFREGQGVIAEGMLLPDGSLQARQILAKHDENYMPPEVAQKLKSMGRWKPDRRGRHDS